VVAQWLREAAITHREAVATPMALAPKDPRGGKTPDHRGP